MSSKDAVGATHEALTTLAAAVLRIRSEYGDTLGVRRLTSDIDRFQADLDELGSHKPGHTPGVEKSQLLEIPDEKAQKALKGVIMELEDCAFPLLAGVIPTGDPMVAFKDADYALLVGSRPRGPGMERAELLAVNGNEKTRADDGERRRTRRAV